MNVSLDELEKMAREAECKTVPGYYFAVMVGGNDLLELVQLVQRATRCELENANMRRQLRAWSDHDAARWREIQALRARLGETDGDQTTGGRDDTPR